jgi:hypothetical protein
VDPRPHVRGTGGAGEPMSSTRGAAQQAVAADQQQLVPIGLGCRLAAYLRTRSGSSQRCCWPLNADPLGCVRRRQHRRSRCPPVLRRVPHSLDDDRVSDCSNWRLGKARARVSRATTTWGVSLSIPERAHATRNGVWKLPRHRLRSIGAPSRDSLPISPRPSTALYSLVGSLRAGRSKPNASRGCLEFFPNSWNSACPQYEAGG